MCGTCVKKPVSFVLPDSLLRAIDLFVESTSHRLSLPISLAHGSFWKLTSLVTSIFTEIWDTPLEYRYHCGFELS